jgi:hypothetical protein
VRPLTTVEAYAEGFFCNPPGRFDVRDNQLVYSGLLFALRRFCRFLKRLKFRKMTAFVAQSLYSATFA